MLNRENNDVQEIMQKVYFYLALLAKHRVFASQSILENFLSATDRFCYRDVVQALQTILLESDPNGDMPNLAGIVAMSSKLDHDFRSNLDDLTEDADEDIETEDGEGDEKPPARKQNRGKNRRNKKR
jgi:hypothetical protein